MRTPPHDIDAERAVIGAILISESALVSVTDILKSGDFYLETHRVIFDAMMRLYAQSEPVDQLTVLNLLKTDGSYDDVGGRNYIFQLIDSVPTAANATRYARIIKGKAVLRRLLDVSAKISQSVLEDPPEITPVVDSAEQMVYEIANGSKESSRFESLSDLAPGALEEIQTLYENGGELTGIPTGFSDVDHLTTGMQDGDLIVLAARPSMGKTAYAVGAGWHVASEHEIPTAIFSLEMSKRQLVQRILSQESGIPITDIRTGKIHQDDWSRLVQASARLTNAPLYIDDTSHLTVPRVRSKARRLASRLRSEGKELGLIIVDYLQLMGGNGENRQNEVAEISRGLKLLARDMDLPVLALAQLSRAVEQRHDKRPLISDLRDSGAIEQDADIVKFLYRDEYYNPDSDDKGVAEVIVGKHRNGATGKVKLAFIAKQARFASLVRT